MKTLIAFDLDGTLSPSNEPVKDSTLKKLDELSKIHHVVLISGKNTSYLSGLCRQLGIKDVYLSGENGSEYIFPATFPPEIHKKTYKTSDEDIIILTRIRSDLLSKYKDKIWEQPNHHAVSFFARTEQKTTLNAIKEYIHESYPDEVSFSGEQGLPAYLHHDAIEILPSRTISKGQALTMIAKDISAERIIAIGDGVNDISMMKIAHYSIGIQKECHTDNHHMVNNINEAFIILEELL